MLNRKSRNRYKLKSKASLSRLRLCVFRSSRHFSAQVIDKFGKILVDVTSNSKKCSLNSLSKKEKAKWVAQGIAQKINKDDEFYLDRGKYAYHGIVRVFAEAAREAGMRF